MKEGFAIARRTFFKHQIFKIFLGENSFSYSYTTLITSILEYFKLFQVRSLIIVTTNTFHPFSSRSRTMHRASPVAKAALYLTLLTLTQCSKCKDDVAPSGELPAATQAGKNTFGCLVNGQVWTPDGRTGITPNLVVDYQPDPVRGGNLNISAYNYAGANHSKQTIKLYAGPIFQTRTFQLDSSAIQGTGSFFDQGKPSPCNELLYYDASYLKGTLTLTRLDQSAGVIAGTFEFKIAKPGCDTVRVTQGRFDWKL